MGRAETKEKYEHAEYPIHIIGRNVEVTDPMKAYAVEKMTVSITRFHARVMDAMIVMDIQRFIHHIDFIITINNIKIKVSGQTNNMYASVDQAMDHLDAKLTRYNRRIHEHRVKGLPEREMNVNIVSLPYDDLNDQIEEENLKKVDQVLKPHTVVAKEKKELKILAVPEAIMKMELSSDAFLIYKSEEDRKLKVMYRRCDGNYGIIEPEV